LPSVHDIYGARLLIKHKIVEPQQIWVALRRILANYRQGKVLGLAAALHADGVLSERHAHKLTAATSRHQVLFQEKLLARLVLRTGVLNRNQLRLLVQEQKKSGLSKGLGPILTERGLITQAQIREIQGQLSVEYAQAVAESEESFLEQIGRLADSYGPLEDKKVLRMLGLAGSDSPTEQIAVSDPEVSVASLTGGLSDDSSISNPRPNLLDSSDDYSPGISGRFEMVDRGGAPQQPAAPSAEPSIRPEDCPIYGYEILKELGKGAMGVVYKARHIFSDRITALKVLPLKFAKDSQYLERFKREAIAAMRLQHENVVRAFDFGGSEDYYYLALEFIDGETLEERLERVGQLSEKEALTHIRGICGGLEFAWAQSILHRDIKPENIMVTKEGQAKLCDFGIVKLLDHDEAAVTMAGTTVGTPYYISPEQARGQDDLDIRSDLYSVGITLFHLLTGQVPFTGKSQGAILVRHILEEVPDPRTLRPDLSADAAGIVRRLTRKKRAERFQSPRDVAEAINRLPVMRG